MMNLYCCFGTKTEYYFILNYKGVGEVGDDRAVSKWNQGKIMETS